MSKVQSVKQHVRRNKAAYISGGVCLVVGAVASAVAFTNPALSSVRAVQVLAYKSNQTIEVFIEALGDPGNIIQDKTTGTIYASQNQAAKALGVYPARISEHLTGKLPNINGHILENLGKAAVVS